MVKNYICCAFLYTVTIASTRALQRLFHQGSESNAVVAIGRLILDPNTVFSWGFFLWYVKM